jgi:hypothetical protein
LSDGYDSGAQQIRHGDLDIHIHDSTTTTTTTTPTATRPARAKMAAEGRAGPSPLIERQQSPVGERSKMFPASPRHGACCY